MKFREETLNMALAELLRGYGFAANPEVILKQKMPDVLLLIGGLKVILEGKAEGAWKALERQAKERLLSGLADISIAIRYPKSLYSAEDLDALRTGISDARFGGAVFSWSQEGIRALELQDKSLRELQEVLDRTVSLYVEDDLLASKIQEINATIGRLAGVGKQTSLLFHTEAVESRLREALGIGDQDGEEEAE